MTDILAKQQALWAEYDKTSAKRQKEIAAELDGLEKQKPKNVVLISGKV